MSIFLFTLISETSILKLKDGVLMKKIDLEELKKIQLEILDYVVKFCKENKINYWIDCGTLLGAVRHKGYIPWDDDIDIGMLRGDFNRFMELFNKHSKRYKFYSVENNKKFNYPFGKVLDTETVLYEPTEKRGNRLAINIDVIVYDNAPDDENELAKMFKKRNIYNMFKSVQISPVATTKKFHITNIIRIPCHYILKLLPKAYFSKKIAENAKKYQNMETKRVGNFTAVFRMVCDKHVFDKFVDIEFEGKKYKAPVGYDEWLKAFYGDYIKLPPVEKRISTHKFVAYKK